MVKAIREFQPEGPYYLGGWCLYGLLMYEAAQQIIADGGEVALLVMIDTVYPSHKRMLPGMVRMQTALQKWFYHAHILARLKVTEIPAYLAQRIHTFRYKLATFWQRREYIRAMQNADQPLEKEMGPIFLMACAHYKPQPYPAPVALFQAVERPAGRYWDLRQVWLNLIRAPLESHDIAGGHHGMFKEPYVAVLGARMKHSLESAQKREAAWRARPRSQVGGSSDFVPHGPVGDELQSYGFAGRARE